MTPPGRPRLTERLEVALGDLLVEEELAHTAASRVFRVRLERFGDRPLALKVATRPGPPDELARFAHEVRLLSETRHPHVVEVLDWGVLPGDLCFLVQELVSPRPVPDAFGDGDWPTFLERARQVTAGLAHIHGQGILHLDLKPSNLGLVAQGAAPGRLVILDFGLARPLEGHPLRPRIRGTLAYTAPEVLTQRGYDARADLYSLGLTLFELATGVLPSAGDTDTSLRFHLEGEPVEPLRFRPDLPEPLADLMRRLLERDPRRRPPSAARVLRELTRLAGESPGASEAAAARSAPPALFSSRLVGREDDLERLRRELARAAEGEGGVVLVEGEEGLGKARLLRELRLAAVLDGARVGRLARGTGQPPLATLEQMVAGLGLESAGSLGGAAGQAEGDPELPAEPSLPVVVPAERAYRLAGRLRQGLEAVAAQAPGPLLLLVEELDAADPTSREVLANLAPDLHRLPVLVVAGRRPPGPGRIDRPGEAAGVRRHPLAPLTRQATAELAAAVLGLEALPRRWNEMLYRASGGVPGRLLEVLRQLVADDRLRWRDGAWQAPAEDEEPPAPALGGWASGDPGWRRLRRLPDGQRTLLTAAALAADVGGLDAASGTGGGVVSLRRLAAVLDEEPAILWGSLAALERQGFLARRPMEDDGATTWSFVHPGLHRRLVEEAEGVEEERRRTWYRRLAEDLEAAGDEGPVVAEAWWRAGEPAAALRHLEHAARQAEAVHAFAEAARWWGRLARAVEAAGERRRARGRQAAALAAAGLWDEAERVYRSVLEQPGLERAEAARLWLALGQLCSRRGDHGEALKALRAGLGRLTDRATAEPPPDHARLLHRLLHGRAVALRDLGRPTEAFEAAREALARAGRAGLPAARARQLSLLASLDFAGDRPRRARRLLERALWVAEGAGETALASKLRNNLANVLWRAGEWRQAEAIHRRHLAACEASGELWGRLAALHNLGVLLASRGRFQEAREPLTESLELKRRLGARESEALTRLNLGEVEEALGDWPAAEAHYQRGVELLAEATDSPVRWDLAAHCASLARRRGEASRAEAMARQALDAARRLEDVFLEARCHHLLARLAADRGHGEAARGRLQRARQAHRDAGDAGGVLAVDLDHLSLELDALAAAGGEIRDDAAAAAPGETVDALLADARQALEELDDPLREGILWWLEGRRAALRGEDPSRSFRAAAERFADLSLPWWQARCDHAWGLATGGPRGRRRLQRAAETFLRLGAEAEGRRVQGALEARAAGPHPATAEPEAEARAVLPDILQVINSTLDRDEVLARTMDLVLECLEAQRGLIVLWDADSRRLTPAVARNLGGDGEERKLSESVVRQVVETGEPVITVDARTDRRFAGAESIVADGIRSILCVPLTIRDRLAGAIYVDHGRSRHRFGDAERDFLLAFADQAALALDNARLVEELEVARRQLTRENESLRREIRSSHHLDHIIGESPAIRQLKDTLERVALSDATVLIRGESGTGKGLVARVLHHVSRRRERRFVHFNCAALPETLVESELFGHEKGAFTGAVERKPGRFELAEGGTVFLDEIGKVSPSVQAKLLRVVEEKAYERVGGTETLTADVRIIAATNLDLEAAIERGDFREDLYYRLNIVPVVLPPLRERREDLGLLARYFVERIARDLGWPRPPALAPELLEAFRGHRWSGNVRELEATIHRALVMASHEHADRALLTVEDFPALQPDLAPAATPSARRRPPSAATFPEAEAVPAELGDGGYQDALEARDRQLVRAALDRCDGKIRETARLLGISRNTLKAKMDRWGWR